MLKSLLLVLVSSSLISALPIFLLAYTSLYVFASVYALVAKASAAAVAPSDNAALSRRSLNSLLNCQALLTFAVMASARFVCTTALCGHLSIGRLAIAMILFVTCLQLIVQKVIIFELLCTSSESWSNYAYCSLLCVFLQLLWFSSSMYALIFCLDCLGALVLLIVFSHDKRDGVSGAYTSLTSVSVFIWVTFVATTLLLLACSYLVLLLSSTTLKNVFIFGGMLSKLSRGEEEYRQQLTNFLIVFALSVKTGVGSLFVWKRAFLKSLGPCALIIYLVLYFGNVTIYTAYITMSLSTALCGTRSLIAAIVILATIFSVTSYDKNSDIYSFFAWSSFFNTVLVFCLVLAEARKPCSVTGDALIKILWHKVI